jgi:hypothetical protein
MKQDVSEDIRYMRTILRNKTTEYYFQGVSDWTGNHAGAFDFQSPERVIKFVSRAGLNVDEMEIVFTFDDARYDIRVPIDERFVMKAATGERQDLWPGVPVLAEVMGPENQSVSWSGSDLSS